MTYFIAGDPSATGSIVRETLRFARLQLLILVPLHGGVVALVVLSEPQGVATAALTTLTAVPALLGQQYALAVLQGQRRFRAFNVTRLLPATAYSSVLALFLLADWSSLPAVTAAWGATATGAAVVSTWIALRGVPRTDHSDDPSPPRRALLSFGYRALLGTVSPAHAFQLDQAVVGLALSPRALGLYAVAVALTNLPRFIAQSVGIVAYPHVAAIKDPTQAQRSMWRFVVATLFLCGAVAAVLAATSDWLIELFFGDAFEQAGELCRILLISAVLVSVRRVLTDASRGTGAPAEGSYAELASWVALAAAMPFLASSNGAEGVAWAMTISSATGLSVLVAMMIRRRPRAPVSPGSGGPLGPGL